MPFYPDEAPTVDFESKQNTSQILTPDRDFAMSYMTGLDRSPGAATLALAGGSVVDLLDTVSSSLIPGVDRQDVNNKFLSAIGSPGLTKFVNDNRGAMEVGSGVLGIIASDYLAGRILKPGGWAMQAIRSVPYARRIATLDSQYDKAVRLANLTTREMANRGMMGVERFAGAEMNLASLGTKPLTTSGNFASRAVFRTQAAKGLARNITTEGVMAATLNSNDFLYSDDLSHNLAWMAGGLAAGGLIDSMISAYTLRKLANQDSIRRINAAAYDVTGLESGRLHSATIADQILRASGASPDVGATFVSHGATTDRITNLAVAAGELQKPRSFTERGMALFGKREAIATPVLKTAMEEVNKVTTSGLSGVSRSGFGTKLEGLGAPLNESLVREPALFYGIEEIGTTVENMTRQQVVDLRGKNLNERLKKAEELLTNGGKWRNKRLRTKDGEVFQDELIPLKEEERQALLEEVKELKFKVNQVPVTMLEPGEWAPIELGQIADNYQPRAIREEGGLGADNVKLWQRERAAKGEPVLGLRSDGELFLPGNGRLESLKTEDMLSLFHIANKAARDFASTGTKFVLPKNPNWFQLDFAEQVIRATGDPASVEFPGAMTQQSAQVESFAQKVASLRKREQAIKLAQRRGIDESLDDVKAFEQKVFFNLPRVTSYQAGMMHGSESPIDILLGGFKSGDDVRKLSHQELLQALNDSHKIANFTEETKDTLESLQGNSFNFLMDRDGTPIKPIIAYKRPMQPQEWTRDHLFVRQAMKHAQVREILTGETADPLTREIVNSIMSDPNAATARRIMELADDQSRSFIPGFRESAPQTTTGSLINAVTSRERRDADNLIMLAASRIKERESRITSAVMKQLIQDVMGDTITLVNSARNVNTKILLNQFHTFRPGWELARDAAQIQLPDGKTGWQFILDHESVTNQKRFKLMFDRDLAKGQPLLNPGGTEIVLDELGMDAVKRLQQIHQAEIGMKNTLLRSQGLPELKVVPWYAPPPSTKGKYVGFTFDMADNVVPDMAIIADSPNQLAEMASELQRSPSWKPGYTFRQRQNIESFMTLWDKAQMDWIAPNTTAIQPKKQNFGRTGGMLMNPNAFDEGLVTIRDNIVKHGTDLLEVLFDDPLKAAYARSQIARVESAVGVKQTQHSSIYDRYVENLLGRNALNAKDSFFGDVFDWAEKRLNGFLNSPQAAKMGDTYQALKDFLRTASPTKSVVGEKFDKLAKELGQYTPYKSATEMLARETGERPPKEVADITSKLSWFEAASRLRWFESMHAVANVGSILANTPSVVKALQPLTGETLEEAAKRNSSLVMMQATPDGQAMGLLNVPKLLWTSMRQAWKPDASRLSKVEKSIRLGFMDQEVAEFERAWGSIDSKEGFKGFVFGNPSADFKSKTGLGIRNKVAKSGGIDKWLSILSDKSEAFTRQWGMHIGFEVAEKIGIRDEDAAIAFAHDLTNKLIANYDPRNRPEVFQGALGAPIGLFQSYVVNFYQRMFRYLETGNARALATQYASQSAVFGVGSVPGWNAVNWAFFDHQQAEGEDPVDSIYRRFGTADGDLIMHGVLSNIPKIFGLDGISLYTRGDSQFRMPVNPLGQLVGGNTANIPVADSLKRLMSGLVAGVGAVKEANGLSWQQASEILSNMITNRPLAGMLEVGGANGFDTSWDGQVVSQTRSASEDLYRILGVRAMRQQKEVEMFYANKNAQEEQNARKTSLRLATRAAIRGGNFDEVPKLFSEYVKQGGDPRYYTRWVKSSFESALDSRGERQLAKALKDEDGSKDAMIGRLLDAQTDINEDDLSTDDYGREAQIDALIEQGWEENPEPAASQELDALGQPPSPSF